MQYPSGWSITQDLAILPESNGNDLSPRFAISESDNHYKCNAPIGFKDLANPEKNLYKLYSEMDNKQECQLILDQIPPTFKFINNFGFVSFIENDSGNWRLEWHMTLSPDYTPKVKGNGIRIISQLKTKKPTGIENSDGFIENILYDILVNQTQIQPQVGDPVDIEIYLNNDPNKDPDGPRGYEYLSVPSGFAR